MILQNSEHQQSEIQHLLTFKKDSLNIYDFKNSIFFAMRIHVYGYIQKLTFTLPQAIGCCLIEEQIVKNLQTNTAMNNQ